MEKITIDPYENFSINGDKDQWYSAHVKTRLPGGIRIPYVNHKTKTSIKDLVEACIDHGVLSQGTSGIHQIEIILDDGGKSSKYQQLAILVTV